ncbi:DUF4214 domain-containing protein [Massilia sp. LC238]|uniref:DUF4214 domain-containing protein n=1 Tax=Massilia sp. LC238 TaxID=1502852 RepID=UPI0004E2A277|nr:DUF4214 domain-containing protein [Massilia sp. LC238]KFC70700.1 Secreted protease C [Massilia sp. LC238]
MATVTDLTTTPLSGLNHIDALLDIGPDWNYMIGVTPNTIYYTFDLSSGTEVNPETGTPVTGQAAFNITQQTAARSAFTYLQQVTGIQFVETSNGSNAQIHLANLDLEGSQTTGLCSWNGPYSYIGNNVVGYKPNAYVYLDNVEWRAQNSNPVPGSEGYQTLLHELGHALGLKHPFHEGDEHDHVHLPFQQDNTGNTIMSYTDTGGPYSTFSPYDIAALNWLYGGDGLGGALGVDAGGRFITGTTGADRITGTAGNDRIVVLGGNDVIDGGGGTDTVVFSRGRGEYSFSENGSGSLLVTHATLGTATLSNIELLAFTDGQYQRSQVTSDVTPPAAPALSVSKNAAGYTSGNKPLVTGSAEANALVRIYDGERLVAETRADANGLFSVVASAFNDGLNYSLRASATDAAGNVSAFSNAVSFNVDATPPVIPTSTLALGAGGNQPVFSGTAEAGTTIQLVRIGDATEIGRTVVKSDGSWRIDSVALPNGPYEVAAVSVDIADNATSAANRMQFTIDSMLNLTGNSLNNTFTPGAGNNAVDGGAGLDTVVYNGARAGFMIERGVYGVSVTDKSGALGIDNLVNVERIQFGDTMVALDIDGSAGEVYRLYRAAFDREPDKGGLSFWIKALDTGNYTLTQISQMFLADKEAQALYSTDPSDSYFVSKLYAHVLHRPAEGAGFDFWVNGLKQASRAEVLAFFSESPENQAQVIGLINNGIEFPLG